MNRIKGLVAVVVEQSDQPEDLLAQHVAMVYVEGVRFRGIGENVGVRAYSGELAREMQEEYMSDPEKLASLHREAIRRGVTALEGARPGSPDLEDLRTHKASRALADAAQSAGWEVSMPYGVGSGYPYLTVKARYGDLYGLQVTWHTHADTMTLRLFSKIAREPRRGWHDLRSLRAAYELLERVAV